MKKKLLTFAISMVGLYLLMAFATWSLNAATWSDGERYFYALCAPVVSFMITVAISLD